LELQTVFHQTLVFSILSLQVVRAVVKTTAVAVVQVDLEPRQILAAAKVLVSQLQSVVVEQVQLVTQAGWEQMVPILYFQQLHLQAVVLVQVRA
jgi:hypothetical protein